MSYDSEAMQAIRKTVEATVERAVLERTWDETSRALITPYVLIHILERLERIESQLSDLSDMIAKEWGYTQV